MRLLSRGAFSFCIIAVFIGIHLYRVVNQQVPPEPVWQQGLELAAILASGSVGVMGFRYRYAGRDRS